MVLSIYIWPSKLSTYGHIIWLILVIFIKGWLFVFVTEIYKYHGHPGTIALVNYYCASSCSLLLVLLVLLLCQTLQLPVLAAAALSPVPSSEPCHVNTVGVPWGVRRDPTGEAPHEAHTSLPCGPNSRMRVCACAVVAA